MKKINISNIILREFCERKVKGSERKSIDQYCKIEDMFYKTLSKNQQKNFEKLDYFIWNYFCETEMKLIEFVLFFVKSL